MSVTSLYTSARPSLRRLVGTPRLGRRTPSDQVFSLALRYARHKSSRYYDIPEFSAAYKETLIFSKVRSSASAIGMNPGSITSIASLTVLLGKLLE